MSAAPASWNRDSLPEGDDKRTAVRDMFDAIAPRYDLVNRIMTFRLDVRWRRASRAGTGPAAGQPRARPGQRHRRPLRRPRRAAGCARSRSTSASACCAADRSGAPRVQADILRLPGARRLGRRRHLRVRAAQPGRPRRLLRRARPRRAPRRAHRPARRRHPARTGSSGSATASTSARSCPASAPCSPTPPPTATCPRSVAYLPAAADDGGDAAPGRVRRRRPPRPQRRHHPAAAPAPG